MPQQLMDRFLKKRRSNESVQASVPESKAKEKQDINGNTMNVRKRKRDEPNGKSHIQILNFFFHFDGYRGSKVTVPKLCRRDFFCDSASQLSVLNFLLLSNHACPISQYRPSAETIESLFSLKIASTCKAG